MYADCAPCIEHEYYNGSMSLIDTDRHHKNTENSPRFSSCSLFIYNLFLRFSRSLFFHPLLECRGQLGDYYIAVNGLTLDMGDRNSQQREQMVQKDWKMQLI